LLLRIGAWTFAAFNAVTLLALLAIPVLLNNPRFHAYLLANLQSRASRSLGVPVTLQEFALHLSTLSVDLYGLTVDGAAPYANPPLLQVQHAQAGVRIVSVLRREWYLDNLRIDRPIVQIFVDKNGVSNLPTFSGSGSSNSSTSVFDLGVRHAVLTNGEVFYNNRPSDLSVDLHDVEFRSSFESLLRKYSGTLAYANGNLIYGGIHPLPHDLQLQFDATPTVFHLSGAKLSSGASQLLLSATVTNYSAPVIQAQYNATIDGSQVAQILHNRSVPTGTIQLTGSAQYKQIANRSLLDSLVVNGDVNSRRLDVKASTIRAQIKNIAAHYSLVNSQAALEDFRASLLGGQLSASGSMANVGGDSHSNLKAELHNISLAQLKQLMGPSASVPQVDVDGSLNASATASWGKTFDNLVAQADAAIHGRVTGAHNSGPQAPAAIQATSGGAGPPASAIPVDSAIHARYTASDSQLALNDTYLNTAQTKLTLGGSVSSHSNLNVQLQAADLHEFETIAALFQPSNSASRPLNLAGSATFQGNVQGSMKAPHLTGQLAASNLRVQGSAWKVIRANIDLSPTRAALQHADIEPEPRGRIALDASAGLAHWSFTNTSPIDVNLQASQMNIADLAKLAGQNIPVTGTLNAAIKVHGTELNPQGDGSVTLTNVNAYQQPVQLIKLTFSGTGDEAHGALAIQLPSGNVQGSGSVRPRDRTYTAQLSAGGIDLARLQALQVRNINATGVLALDVQGQGSFDNPQFDGTLRIPKLVIQNQAITGLALHVNEANRVANATLQSSAINTSIQAKARIELTGDYLADASIDTQAIPLQPLLAIYAPEQAGNLSGQTEVHATLHGPLKNPGLLEAHVSIPVLKVAYGSSIQLAAASPIRVDYKNKVVDLQRAEIRGTDTDLQIQGSFPTTAHAPMSLLLLGTVDLQLAQLFNPDIRSSGKLKFNLNSKGGADEFGAGGEIDIQDANFASDDLPAALEHANGALTLTKDRINISRFEGTVGGGTITAQGGIAYRPGVQFDLGVAAKGIRILYPQGMRESIDANLRMAGTTDDAVLGGSVNLSDLSFTQAFDLNSFIGQFSGGAAPPPSQGFAQNLRLNVAVRSSNSVNLVSRTLSVDGTANLQVRGTAAEPVILGRVNLNNGDIILNGDRFVLSGGTIQFVNPSETQPVVNLSLTTTIQQYNINLRFNGPIAQLHTEYSSDPSLPSADIINLLAFGQTTEANSANPATPANQAAESLVASQVSSQVTGRFSKIAGISQLSINPVLAGSNTQGSTDANITIQQRVTGNLFVTFSTNVGSTQSQTIQGQYQISPRVALSATRDPNGGFAFDALIKKTW
jgi:translocation and assembly module TamB